MENYVKPDYEVVEFSEDVDVVTASNPKTLGGANPDFANDEW